MRLFPLSALALLAASDALAGTGSVFLEPRLEGEPLSATWNGTAFDTLPGLVGTSFGAGYAWPHFAVQGRLRHSHRFGFGNGFSSLHTLVFGVEVRQTPQTVYGSGPAFVVAEGLYAGPVLVFDGGDLSVSTAMDLDLGAGAMLTPYPNLSLFLGGSLDTHLLISGGEVLASAGIGLDVGFVIRPPKRIPDVPPP